MAGIISATSSTGTRGALLATGRTLSQRRRPRPRPNASFGSRPAENLSGGALGTTWYASREPARGGGRVPVCFLRWPGDRAPCAQKHTATGSGDAPASAALLISQAPGFDCGCRRGAAPPAAAAAAAAASSSLERCSKPGKLVRATGSARPSATSGKTGVGSLPTVEARSPARASGDWDAMVSSSDPGSPGAVGGSCAAAQRRVTC